jgi:hypothetical protein
MREVILMAHTKSTIDDFNSIYGYISKNKTIIELQDKIIENQTEMIANLEHKIELYEEIVKRQDQLIEILKDNA